MILNNHDYDHSHDYDHNYDLLDDLDNLDNHFDPNLKNIEMHSCDCLQALSLNIENSEILVD